MAMTETRPEAAQTDTPSPSAPASTPAGVPTMTPTPGKPNASSPSNTADPSGEQADVTIDVTVANGKVNPSGATIKVKAGQTVLVKVISDADDELHIHGYDVEREVEPGQEAKLHFKADLTGRFEIEDHESEKELGVLQVRPR